MFVVTVDFIIKPEHGNEFMAAMKQNAAASLHHEDGCLQFDVCQDPGDRRRIFLYEVYRDDEAFEYHLKTDHFLEFKTTVSDWTTSKSDQKWERVAG